MIKVLLIAYGIAALLGIIFFIGAASGQEPKQKDDDKNPSVEG